MKPKPPPGPHRRELLRTLAFGLSRSRPRAEELLDADDSVFTLVSWTRLFYGSERDLDLDRPGIERLLASPEPSRDDISEIDSLTRSWRRRWHLLADSYPRIGRAFLRESLATTLLEVQRYLDDEDGIAGRIRTMLDKVLNEAADARERILLIGHSLGSVIAYDCLCRSQTPVELFVTLGSPLATRFVRFAVDGADASGRLAYPPGVGAWKNFAAHGEMTALHPRLAPFVTGGEVEDRDIYNHFRMGGALNVHKSYGYLANTEVAATIGDWLLADGPKP